MTDLRRARVALRAAEPAGNPLRLWQDLPLHGRGSASCPIVQEDGDALGSVRELTGGGKHTCVPRRCVRHNAMVHHAKPHFGLALGARHWDWGGLEFRLESGVIVRDLARLARRQLKLLSAGYRVLHAQLRRLVRWAQGDMVGWKRENRSAARRVLGVQYCPRSRRSSFRSTAYMRP